MGRETYAVILSSSLMLAPNITVARIDLAKRHATLQQWTDRKLCAGTSGFQSVDATFCCGCLGSSCMRVPAPATAAGALHLAVADLIVLAAGSAGPATGSDMIAESFGVWVSENWGTENEKRGKVEYQTCTDSVAENLHARHQRKHCMPPVGNDRRRGERRGGR